MNGTAAYVWSRFQDQAAPGAIASELSATLGVTLDRVRGDVASLLRRWRASGLLPRSRSACLPQPTESFPAAAARLTVLPQRDAHAAAPPTERAYRLLDCTFRLRMDPPVAPLIEAHLGHLARALDHSSRQGPTLDVYRSREHWILALDGEVLGECADLAGVVPLVHGNLGLLAYGDSDCLAVLHAAAVARGSRCVLMPAASGSGKSTLTAALAAIGYTYCADDLAILSRAPVRLRPAPVRIGLKEGAWPVIEPLAPEVAQLPTFERADGKRVRYWLPANAAAGAETKEVCALVFPRFEPGTGTRLRPVARSAALLRLADAGYDLPGRLEPAWVRAMTEWLQGLDCYELGYGDLDGAIEACARVLP